MLPVPPCACPSWQVWEDGILSEAIRNTVVTSSQADEVGGVGRRWIVLDGPVDSVWVEALNPVLDDNRALSVGSGETIPVGMHVNVLIEVRTCGGVPVSMCV